MSARKPSPKEREREEKRLDEALEETFPASDTPTLIAPGGGITGPYERKERLEDIRERTPSVNPKRR
jgi:hypothetical protein